MNFENRIAYLDWLQAKKNKMKKRIFIAMQYLEIGGAERSLVEMLNTIDYRKCDIDLFIYCHHGELMDSIPKEVNLLPESKPYSALARPIRVILKEGHILIAIARLWAKWRSSQFEKKRKVKDSITIFQYVANYTTPLLPSLKGMGRYDLAISYLIPHNIVRDKVDAKRKWAWIHTDYSYVGINEENEYPVWSAFDRIAAVSSDVADSFIGKFPMLERKVFVFENILSESSIREKAKITKDETNLSLMSNYKGVKLCSVGRFSYPKAFDRAVEICYYLVTSGIDCRWFVIGYGSDEQLIRAAIKEWGMEEHFIILGKKNNPYPYINACDIYVQPSRYEGKSVTVSEAQILCKPVVITAYATAKSQVNNGNDGIIVPNEAKDAAKGLANLIQDIPLRNHIISFLKTHHYGNEKEINKLYSDD